MKTLHENYEKLRITVKNMHKGNTIFYNVYPAVTGAMEIWLKATKFKPIIQIPKLILCVFVQSTFFPNIRLFFIIAFVSTPNAQPLFS
jgi:hypothetical protein